MLAAFERVAQCGVPEATLVEEKAVLLRGLEAAADEALARPSAAYADEYVEHFLTGHGTLLSPVQKLALGRAMLPAITSAVLAQAAQQLVTTTAGERIFVQLPRFSHVRPPTRESVLALVDSVHHAAIPAESVLVQGTSPLLPQLPTPGHITRERRDKVSGITEWTLSNGARVILKPTGNDPDEVLIRAWSPGGFSCMPDTLFFTPGRMVARLMTEAAGLGNHNRDALKRQLATTGLRDFRVHIGYADESIDLAGSPRDLRTLFQLLYLQFTMPNLDTAAIHSWASLARYQGPEVTLQNQLELTFARGDPRLLPITTDLADLVRPDQAMAVYRNRFGNAGNFTFTIVGAITPQEARPLVERYVASLPATGEHEVPMPVDLKPFLPKVDFTFRNLELPRALTTIVFDGPFPSSPDGYLQARRELDALLIVLRDRIRVRIREQLGGSYSPSIDGVTYGLPQVGQPDEHYRVVGGFVSAPGRMRELWTEFRTILDSARAKEATPAELTRAATILRRQHETALQDNAYWLNTIGLYNRLGISLDKIIDPYGTTALTPSEFRTAAQRYLPNDVYIHLTAMPQDSTSYTRRDSTGSQ